MENYRKFISPTQRKLFVAIKLKRKKYEIIILSEKFVIIEWEN